MRAIWFCYVMLLMSLGTGMLSEWNQLHMRDKGYPLIPIIVSGTVYTSLNESSYTSTLSKYGLDGVPSQTGDSANMGSGGTLLQTYNALEDVFLIGTLGLSSFLLNLFPAIPLKWLITISAIVALNNVYATITFIRGVAARWL